MTIPLRRALSPLLLVWALGLGTAYQASAQGLAPHQQQALDTMLATADPDTRALLQSQLAPTLALMDEFQVAAMLDAYMVEQTADTETSIDDQDAAAMGSPEDIAYNRAQYEPAIRSAWQAQKSFDDFVTAALHEHCTAAEAYAVWGQAWRYELYPLDPNWPRASESADLDVEIIGSAYAPSDGRYRFDFSALPDTFDQLAVDAAIATACREYNQIGTEFVRDARSRIVNARLPDGETLMASANGHLEPVRRALEDALRHHAPAGTGALYQALISAQRID
jgi:hypothetical protein